MDFGGFQDAVQVRRLCVAVAEGYDCVRHGTVCSCRLNRRANLTAFGGSRIGVFGADSVLTDVPREASSRVVARGGGSHQRIGESRHVRRVARKVVVPERRVTASRHRRLASERVVGVDGDDSPFVHLPLGSAARPRALDERTVRGRAAELVSRRVAREVRPDEELASRLRDDVRLLAENIAAKVLDSALDRGFERDAVRQRASGDACPYQLRGNGHCFDDDVRGGEVVGPCRDKPVRRLAADGSSRAAAVPEVGRDRALAPLRAVGRAGRRRALRDLYADAVLHEVRGVAAGDLSPARSVRADGLDNRARLVRERHSVVPSVDRRVAVCCPPHGTIIPYHRVSVIKDR